MPHKFTMSGDGKKRATLHLEVRVTPEMVAWVQERLTCRYERAVSAETAIKVIQEAYDSILSNMIGMRVLHVDPFDGEIKLATDPPEDADVYNGSV